MQEGVIFAESIARNIAVGDDEIDEERLKQAAETACIFDFVMSLPLKFNTIIGADGIGLSQGQKQRILLAADVMRSTDSLFPNQSHYARYLRTHQRYAMLLCRDLPDEYAAFLRRFYEAE